MFGLPWFGTKGGLQQNAAQRLSLLNWLEIVPRTQKPLSSQDEPTQIDLLRSEISRSNFHTVE